MRSRSWNREALGVLMFFVALSLAAILTPAPALALNPERHYELVSPPYKGGYSVLEINAVAPTGEAVAFASQGTFAGSPSGETSAGGYLARREPSGWSTIPIVPPAAVAPTINNRDYSATLESALVETQLGPSEGAAQYGGTQLAFVVHGMAAPDTVAGWETVGQLLEDPGKAGAGIDAAYVGASADFSHVLFSSTSTLLLPGGNPSKGEELYELLARPVEGPALRLVALNDEGQLANRECIPRLGGSEPPRTSAFNAVAAGGSELFFSLGVRPGAIGDCGGSLQVFVRLDGSRTLEVSRPLSVSCPEGPGVPCAGAATRPEATFVGANEAGTRVFFETKAPLSTGDEDEANDLYMAAIGCPGGGEGCGVAERVMTSLVQVSHDPVAMQAAEVQGVVRVSPDGSHVYFVARGVLSEGANAEGALPRLGAENLYVYDTASGETTYVADLCSGSGFSGVLEDTRCPLSLEGIPSSGERNDGHLWSHGRGAGTSPDGRFLVFASFGQLAATDTDEAQDIYRYDAVTGSLMRVSVGEAGYDANGNDSHFDAKILAGEPAGLDGVTVQHEMASLSMSDDGSRIVFTTSEPLSPGAINGLPNAYEWHQSPGGGQGVVSLVSSGSAETPVEEVVISPSGSDVFFKTSQGLVAQDTDGANDIYDARLGSGFPAAPAARQECSGDACQGPLTNPAPLLVPGSVSQALGQNLSAGPVSVPAVVVRAKAKPVRCRKGFVNRKGKCVRKPKLKPMKSSRGTGR
jgi:hypothetical protein